MRCRGKIADWWAGWAARIGLWRRREATRRAEMIVEDLCKVCFVITFSGYICL